MAAKRPGQPPACFCGRLGASRKPLSFPECCGRYLDYFETTPAPDAESLMRSRYSAFVLGQPGYLLATWHADRRPAGLELQPDAKWLGLEIRAHRVIDTSHAEVEFVARYRASGKQADGAGSAVRQHERSRFVREDGRWFYVDGDVYGSL